MLTNKLNLFQNKVLEMIQEQAKQPNNGDITINIEPTNHKSKGNKVIEIKTQRKCRRKYKCNYQLVCKFKHTNKEKNYFQKCNELIDKVLIGKGQNKFKTVCIFGSNCRNKQNCTFLHTEQDMKEFHQE